MNEAFEFRKFYNENENKIKEVEFKEDENKFVVETEEMVNRLTMNIELQPNLRTERNKLMKLGKAWCKWAESEIKEEKLVADMKNILGEELLDEAYYELYGEER